MSDDYVLSGGHDIHIVCRQQFALSESQAPVESIIETYLLNSLLSAIQFSFRYYELTVHQQISEARATGHDEIVGTE